MLTTEKKYNLHHSYVVIILYDIVFITVKTIELISLSNTWLKLKQIKQYYKDINLEKHYKTMSKWMVIVKLWENGDKLGKIKYLWSNEEMIDDINLDIVCL
jgi:hypothetical protein